MKRCRRCGHEPCPHCGDWCDVLLDSAADGHVDEGDVEPDGTIVWPVLCCGGACDYGEPFTIVAVRVDGCDPSDEGA